MSLDVYLRGEPIGSLFPTAERGCRFGYSPEAVERHGAGKALLSNSLPVRSEPFGVEATRAYLEGLLPQGHRRRTIARELGLHPGDGYGLVAELGGDCLGAVTFLDSDDEGAHDREAAEPAWLGDEELSEVVNSPPGRLFDPDRPERMRFALPGERHKLALVRDEESGSWAWPTAATPSTHIVKPEPADRPGLATNEHACTLAYRELGLPVAHTSVEMIAARPCLVSRRFDRWGDGPRAERLHQESFAQALGISPDHWEGRLASGTPSLREASGLLRAIDEEQAVETLVRTVVCDILLGCTDLRGGNAALLFAGERTMLAPFYDIASTEIYGETRPRPIVIGAPPAPLLVDLRYAIEFCGLELQPWLIESVRMMGTLCVALDAVVGLAQAEDWYRPVIDEAIGVATSRALGFRDESQYLRPPGA